jgi:hypothetical protein
MELRMHTTFDVYEKLLVEFKWRYYRLALI